MKSNKTTIAIIPESRQKLGVIKDALQVKYQRFVDMDEVIRYVLDKVYPEFAEK